jgi:hypothetical protein
MSHANIASAATVDMLTAVRRIALSLFKPSELSYMI